MIALIPYKEGNSKKRELWTGSSICKVDLAFQVLTFQAATNREARRKVTLVLSASRTFLFSRAEISCFTRCQNTQLMNKNEISRVS